MLTKLKMHKTHKNESIRDWFYNKMRKYPSHVSSHIRNKIAYFRILTDHLECLIEGN